MTRDEQIEQAAEQYAWVGNLYNLQSAFTAGAKWADRHHYYDYKMDERTLEREASFMDDWLATHDNMPTFADALEWERKRIIGKACEWLNRKIDPKGNGRSQVVLFHDYIKDFKIALEE